MGCILCCEKQEDDVLIPSIPSGLYTNADWYDQYVQSYGRPVERCVV